jgi:hypothetical protein
MKMHSKLQKMYGCLGGTMVRDAVKLVCKSANLHQFRVLGQFLGAHAMKYSLVDRYLYKTDL